MRTMTAFRPLAVFIGITLMALCLTVGRAWAQESNPLPDPCHPCTFAMRAWSQIAPVATFVTTPDGCTFKVWYKKRLCTTDGCQELKLEKIRPYPEPPAMPPPQCLGISPDELTTLVLGTMISGNQMGFEPSNIGHGSNGCWRIVRASCWAQKDSANKCTNWPLSGGSTDTASRMVLFRDLDYVPCDTSACCTNVLYPTRDGCGELVFDTPLPEEYAWLHGLRDFAPEGEAALNDAKNKFENQFGEVTCVPCTLGSPPPPPQQPACVNTCRKDIMKEYFKLLNKRTEDLYQE